MTGVLVDMKMKSDDKNKALEAAIGQIEKAFGKGSVMKLGQRESAVDVQAISKTYPAEYQQDVLEIYLKHSALSRIHGPVLRGILLSRSFPASRSRAARL